MDQATRSYERDEEERGVTFEEQCKYWENPANAWELQRLRFLAEIAALEKDEHPARAWELQRLRRLVQLAALEKEYWEHPASSWELQRMRKIAAIDKDYYERSKERRRCTPGNAANAASEDQ